MLNYQLSECHSMLDTNVTAYTDVAVLNERFSHLLLIVPSCVKNSAFRICCPHHT